MPNELGDGLTEGALQILRQRDRRLGLYRDIAIGRCAYENIIDWSFRFKAQQDRRSASEIQAFVEASSRKKVNAKVRTQLLLKCDSGASGRATPLCRCSREGIFR